MRIGFVGIGIMGAPMAMNLIKAGHELHIHSRSCRRCDPLLAEGAVREPSPAAVAAASEVFISMVPDTPDVEQIFFGSHGAAERLQPGSVAIDMSTISPKATTRLAGRLASKGVTFLDAPVSGGEQGAKDASLSIMVGGDRQAFDRCLPVLKALGRTIVHTGLSGSGQKTKLVNQVVGSLNLLAVIEGLRLAEASGLDAQTTLDAVASGAAGSWMWTNLGPKIVTGNSAPGFMIKLHQKDLRLARELFEELGLDGPGTRLTSELFTKALEMGLGELGNQALYQVWR